MGISFFFLMIWNRVLMSFIAFLILLLIRRVVLAPAKSAIFLR